MLHLNRTKTGRYRLTNMKTDNELIAEFLELEEISADIKLWIAQPVTEPHVAYPENKLLYDISWDWLMPVVSKCFDYGELDNEFRDQIIASLSGVIDIDDTYKAVLEFIKWYNQQTK